MSRCQYSDDVDGLDLGRWRAQVKSAIRGRRGQDFLKELAAAMDAMPVKELIAGELIDDDGQCCTIGVVCKARGVDVSGIDFHCPENVGGAVNISHQMAAEIEYLNDDCGSDYKQDGDGRWRLVGETPAERWVRMRKWVQSQIKN